MGDPYAPWDTVKQQALEAAILRSTEIGKVAELMEKVVLIYERPKHWNGKNRSFNRAWKTFVGKHVDNCTKLHEIIEKSREDGVADEEEEEYKQQLDDDP